MQLPGVERSRGWWSIIKPVLRGPSTDHYQQLCDKLRFHSNALTFYVFSHQLKEITVLGLVGASAVKHVAAASCEEVELVLTRHHSMVGKTVLSEAWDLQRKLLVALIVLVHVSNQVIPSSEIK